MKGSANLRKDLPPQPPSLKTDRPKNAKAMCPVLKLDEALSLPDRKAQERETDAGGMVYGHARPDD